MRIVTVILIGVCGIYLGLRLMGGEPGVLRKAAASQAASQASQSSVPPRRWYKGNTHTHTLNSDGDSTPDDVVRWYRENRYNFLVLTDHNYLTGVDGLQALHGADEKFLVIRGEEVTDSFGGKPIHINGLNPSRLITPQGGGSVIDVIQRNIDAIRAALAVPHINHPNFGWAIVADELRQARNYRLFEIYNGHPTVNNQGGGDSPGLEQMWDYLLHQGQELYGVAVDDAHVFKRPWDTTAARPGRGWIYVRAERLAPEPLMAALERGDFYASTGVELADYQADARSIRIAIKEEKTSKYRIQFIGRSANPWDGGRVLKEVTTLSAVYEIRGDEGYIRAKIFESNGKAAWTQPVMVGKK